MANVVVISTITPQGGDAIYVTGTVNGQPSSVTASRAVIGSFANATNAQSYLSMLLLHNCPQGVTQGGLAVVPGTVNS
jgi:hypothetical protein